MKIPLLFAGLIGLASAGAFGQQAGSDQASGSALPEAQSENGFRFVSGGVGSSDAEAMKQAARDHNLMLTFATRRGNYLADVDVDIADARGHSPLKTTCDGPIMLVDVPKGGRYVVRAEVAGRSASDAVQVQPHAKGKRLALVWPAGSTDQG